MDSEGTLIPLILLVIFMAGWPLLDYFKKLYQNQNLFQKVGWIAEKEKPFTAYGRTDASLRSQELIFYIVQQQKKLNITTQYCIDSTNEKEKKDAEEILNLHKKYVIESYFHAFLTKSHKICNLNSLEYYFYSLYCFICNELDEYKYNQDKIYTDIEYTDKNYFNCQLTGYGRAYYKLYLITLTFVENNGRTKKLFEYINPNLKELITEHLDKNEVCFWSYRP